jgi:DNA-directed RNA polymerase beta subunit
LKFDLLTLKQIFPKKNDAILLSFENVKVDHIDHVDDYRARVFITWEIPFRLGDKITNLHGAKGTVGLILPDDKMPRLTKQVGNMKAGPLEIIISGFSAMRRGSLGQLFEAWSLATGHTDVDFISEAIEKYGKEMEDYSKKSVVEYNGQKSTIPVGINYIMRLYHHASTKVSCSSADFAYKRTLRFGEMEKLNLVANDCPNILKELGIRSVTKYIGSHRLINQIEETRELPKNAHMSLQFVEILKSMGYKLTVSRLSDDYSKMDEKDEEYVNDRLKNKESKSDENDD